MNMGSGQPFIYDQAPKESSRHAYSSFDPRAASRASFAPAPVRSKQEGALITFNAHPEYVDFL